MTSSNLPEELIQQYRKAFALYEKEEDGKISPKDLGIVMRSLGQNPTEAELQEIINEIDAERKGTVEFFEFVNIMEKKIENVEDEEEILSAFRIFDNDGSGLISAEELREALTSLGEKLTQEEVDDLFSEAEIGEDGLFNYHDLCQAVLQ